MRFHSGCICRRHHGGSAVRLKLWQGMRIVRDGCQMQTLLRHMEANHELFFGSGEDTGVDEKFMNEWLLLPASKGLAVGRQRAGQSCCRGHGGWPPRTTATFPKCRVSEKTAIHYPDATLTRLRPPQIPPRWPPLSLPFPPSSFPGGSRRDWGNRGGVSRPGPLR